MNEKEINKKNEENDKINKMRYRYIDTFIKDYIQKHPGCENEKDFGKIKQCIIVLANQHFYSSALPALMIVKEHIELKKKLESI